MRSLPTLADDPTAPDATVRPCEPMAADALSRRGFVSTATWSVLASALASACGGGAGDGPTATPGPTATGVTYASGSLRVPLASVPSLAQTNGFLITNGGSNDVTDSSGRRPNVIVISVGNSQWRAFTSTCTHDNCTVGDYTGSRIRCFCHGSEYDNAGRVAVGPATRALQEYTVTFEAATNTIVVARG